SLDGLGKTSCVEARDYDALLACDERVLSEVRNLRQSAVRESESVAADANNWLDFERTVPHYLAAMQREYDEVHNFDLTPVSQVVQKAEQDWPAKKNDLDGRL